MQNNMLPSPHRIIKVVQETQAEYTFRVAYDGEIRHGQFFQLSIPKVGEAPISVSGKGDGFVEFTIRKIGRLTNGIFGLNQDDTIFMRGPYGNGFPVELFKQKDLVVITGGTGMAPVKTMLHYFASHEEECRQVYLIAGFKDINAALFHREREYFSIRFHTIYTLDTMEAPGFQKGFVTAYIDRIPFRQMEDYNVAVVGPPMMMDAAAKECIKHGAAEEKIWMSFERKMSCAVGKCGHCKINETYVCLDGPVFNYVKAKKMFD